MSETGTTREGVPYLIGRTGSPGSPVIVAWHLLDAPRTEAAFAAALPLTGLDATTVYLGLPMTGSRSPEGGPEALFALLGRDAPALVHGPIYTQAVAEFPAAFAELSERLDLAGRPLGLLGGSMGSMIAAGVLAAGSVDARAAVLVSPFLRLRTMIDAFAPMFGGYEWSPEADAFAERMDFVARADEVARSGAAIRVLGGADDEQAMLGPAREFADAVGAEFELLPGLGHALAEEPGTEPAPQTEGAHRIDALAADWFRARLG